MKQIDVWKALKIFISKLFCSSRKIYVIRFYRHSDDTTLSPKYQPSMNNTFASYYWWSITLPLDLLIDILLMLIERTDFLTAWLSYVRFM